MQTTELIIRELIVHRRRLWRSAGLIVGCAVLGLGLSCGFAAVTQEPDAAPQGGQTNDAAAEVLSRIGEMVQSDSAEDTGAPKEGLTETNGSPQTANSGQLLNRLSSSNRFANPDRGQSDDRRSRGRRSSRMRAGQSGESGSARDYGQGGDRSQANAGAGTNSGPARLNYSAFKLILDRNIFDPNRVPIRPGGVRRIRTVDSLTLRGTITYEKGTYAVFEGSSADYTKKLKLNDRIAGYKVTNIGFNGVQLAAGTNTVDLLVGMQLRREEDGPWVPSSKPASYAATATSTSFSSVASTDADAASGGPESETIKKLKQKRAQE